MGGEKGTCKTKAYLPKKVSPIIKKKGDKCVETGVTAGVNAKAG